MSTRSSVERATHRSRWKDDYQAGELELKSTSARNVLVVILGAPNSGKRSLISRLMYDDMNGGQKLAMAALQMTDEPAPFVCGGYVYELEVAPLQEQVFYAVYTEFRFYFGIVLAYDVHVKSTFKEVSRLYDALQHSCEDGTIPFPITVLGLKSDLERSAEGGVAREEGQRFAQDRGCLFSECSAATGDGVVDAFGMIAGRAHDIGNGFEGKAKEFEIFVERLRKSFVGALLAIRSSDSGYVGLKGS